MRKTRKILWRLETINTNTGKSSRRKVSKTYDEMTRMVARIRARNMYISVSAQELNRGGLTPKSKGKFLAECSRFEEQTLYATVDEFDDIEGEGYYE